MKTIECPHCKGNGRVFAPTPADLKEYRQSAGLSQAKLALAMGGMSVPYISDLERGNRNINPRVAEKWDQACEAAKREKEIKAAALEEAFRRLERE